jgi:hypothetical protein
MSTNNDVSDERLRAAFASLAGRPLTSKDCPSHDLLWSAVRGELPRNRIRQIGLHAVSCPACAESWRLARDIATDIFPQTDATPEPETRITRPLRWWLGWGSVATAAAALLVVAVVMPLWQPAEDSRTPSFRATVGEPIHSLLPEQEALPRDSCLLRWAGPEGARFDVQVAMEDLTVLTRVEALEIGEYLVPEEILAGSPEGAKILWQVEVVLPDGRRLTSRTFVTELE